jgi:hypothetical protein
LSFFFLPFVITTSTEQGPSSYWCQACESVPLVDEWIALLFRPSV